MLFCSGQQAEKNQQQPASLETCNAACRSPASPDTILIKRLLALEGDWVTLPDRVDIEKIPQVRFNSFDGPTSNNCTLSTACPMLQGHCWLEGDNADLSEDSRSKYGAVCRLQLYVHDVLHHRDHTHLLVCRSSVQRI